MFILLIVLLCIVIVIIEYCASYQERKEYDRLHKKQIIREDVMRDYQAIREGIVTELWKLWRLEKEPRWKRYLIQLMENVNTEERDVNDVILDLQNQILYTKSILERDNHGL